jgi:uncharacterized repeat protein (TIGR02543 family)
LGDVVQLTAVPAAGWSFSAWSGALTGSVNPASLTVTGNMSVTATFIQNAYALTVSTVGSGSVTKSPDQATYASGTVVTLTAVPGAGWSFSAWSGDLSGSVSPTTITINGNRTVTATFTQNAYSVSVTVLPSSAAGTVTPNATGPYHYNDVVVLTESPSLGYTFSGWSGDGSGTGSTRSVTVTGNMSVTATFSVYTPFSIVSNSTVTQLAFDSTSKVLEFTVSGPSGTFGFTNVTIAKTLISDITTLNITFDGKQMNYTVNDLTYSWSIYFTYHHSTHRVVMDFVSQQTETPSAPSNAVAVAIIGLAIVISATLAIAVKRKRRFSNKMETLAKPSKTARASAYP